MREIFLHAPPLRECLEASICQGANPMYEETVDSCLPARRACQVDKLCSV